MVAVWVAFVQNSDSAEASGVLGVFKRKADAIACIISDISTSCRNQTSDGIMTSDQCTVVHNCKHELDINQTTDIGDVFIVQECEVN